MAIIPESAPNNEKFQNSVDTFIYVEDKDIDLIFEVVHCITGLLSVDAIVGDYADVKFDERCSLQFQRDSDMCFWVS